MLIRWKTRFKGKLMRALSLPGLTEDDFGGTKIINNYIKRLSQRESKGKNVNNLQR